MLVNGASVDVGGGVVLKVPPGPVPPLPIPRGGNAGD